MTIELHQLGKRYNRHWIFKNLSATLKAGAPVAITGANGSGKSTLLQVLAGALEKSTGTIHWESNGREIVPEKRFSSTSVCAPYLELIEELTLTEFFEFHATFKKWLPGLSIPQIIASMDLQAAANKQIRDFSSGMKQRVKLAQAILTDTPALFLDEPTSNLDLKGIAMYHQWMQQYTQGRLLVIASNDETEIGFCQQRIHISDYAK
ncbi:MAG TPA: ATP-binding cassette domain-containing protein [Phnomibacter sp.]|nr:ATP-binding cassette domain-containing protein [Phnomibacter sp.]